MELYDNIEMTIDHHGKYLNINNCRFRTFISNEEEAGSLVIIIDVQTDTSGLRIYLH